jgi:predicted tellurium resistance membrane protein TerC
MSTFLAKLMDRYPIILWIGAAVLGKVGGQMMITDPWVHGLLNPPNWAEYASMAFFVLFIVVLAKILINRRDAGGKSGAGHGAAPMAPAVETVPPEGGK